MDFVNIYREFNKNSDKKLTRLGDYSIDFLILQKLNEGNYGLPISVFTKTAIIQPPRIPEKIDIEDYLKYGGQFLKAEIDFFQKTSLETGLQTLILRNHPFTNFGDSLIKQTVNDQFYLVNDEYVLDL